MKNGKGTRDVTTVSQPISGNIASALDHLGRFNRFIRDRFIFQRLTVITRILLAMGFIPTGMVKVLGQRFTQMGIDTDIGFFFEALYRTGGWWRFLGLVQVIACVLLLIPRTTTLGALLFFPTILNIVIITLSLDFNGTPVVTSLMLLATMYILFWDYDRIRAAVMAILGYHDRTTLQPVSVGWTFSKLERAAFVLLAVSGIAIFFATRFPFPMPFVFGCLIVGIFGSLLLGAEWLRIMGRAVVRRRVQSVLAVAESLE